MIRLAYANGRRAAFAKFALGPPTQVDEFMANVEHGKDVLPEAANPPMSHVPGDMPTALDGTTPLQTPQTPSSSPPTPPGLGSTVGEPPPPNMGMLGG